MDDAAARLHTMLQVDGVAHAIRISSSKLGGDVYVVAKKTGRSGAHEITPEQAVRMHQLKEQGWSDEDIIYRVMGIALA